MRTRKLWLDLVTLTALVCLITTCFWAALAGPKTAPSGDLKETSSGTTVEAPSVSVVTLSPQSLEGRLSSRGVVSPSSQVKVVSESTARILKRNVEVGDVVKKDALLLELDGSITKIQLDAATAQVASAKALLSEAESEVETAQELKDEELEKQAKARRDAAKASLQLAESRQAEAELSHDRRLIKAPVAGVISQCYLEAGEFAAAGRPVAEIVTKDPVRIIVKLTAQELDEASQAEVAWKVASPNGSNADPLEAKVCFISPVADPVSKRFDLVLEVENAAGAFPIGAKVDATCDWKTAEPELAIPRKALVRRADNLVCLRIETTDDVDVCREVPVQIASIPGSPETVRVVGGLSENDRIVTGRLLGLRDGLEVKVQN